LKIGIFGGTFNPVHYGHLINAEFIRDAFSLDRILFIPSKAPVHKDLAENISPDDRFAILERAISGNSCFQASRVELDRHEPSYTVHTVDQIKAAKPGDEIFLIIGDDSFLSIHTWKDYRSLLKAVPVIVMNRQGNMVRNAAITYDVSSVYYAGNPIIGISSTVIRERVRLNRSIRYLVPDEVIDYIMERELYWT